MTLTIMKVMQKHLTLTTIDATLAYPKDKVNEIISDTCIPKHVTIKTSDIQGNTDIDSSDSTHRICFRL